MIEVGVLRLLAVYLCVLYFEIGEYLIFGILYTSERTNNCLKMSIVTF
jgi:hypothetical protein